LNANSDNEVSAKLDYAGRKQNAESLAEVIKLISEAKSLLIFKTIFLASGDTGENLGTHLKLTKKQFYSRISRLTKAGLVTKSNEVFCNSLITKEKKTQQRL